MRNKRLIYLLATVCVAVGMFAVPLTVVDGDEDGKVTLADITRLIGLYQEDNTGTVNVANIQALITEYLYGATETEFNDTIYVTYDGESVNMSQLPTDGSIMASVDGANVVLTSMVTDREICCVLAGTSDCGSFVWNGSYKMTVRLNGLSLKGSTEEAINIKCGKRIALELADGTVNTLEDATTDGTQKGAFYTKGHLEISGGGTLNLVGNVKHGLSSKEYLLIKKTAGTINVNHAAKDGIHAGQYFKMNGGTVTVSDIDGDGIQAEATSDGTDENNGQLIINGGTINITTTAAANKGLKSDSTLHIAGGTITITQTGDKIVEADDISYTTGIKSGADINITGGSVTIDNRADGGKGISADGNISINETAGTTAVNITANGAGDVAEYTGGSTTEPEVTASYVVYVALPTTGSGGGGRPGQQSNAWTTLYIYKSDGTLVQQLTNTVTKTVGYTSKTFYYYDFKAADSGTYYFKSANYTSRGNNTTYTIRSSTFTGATSGEDYYYEISNSYTTSGSTRTYSLSNVTNTWNGGTSDVGEDSGTSYNAAGIKADGNVSIKGGTVTVKNSGSMSKSIKSKATVTIDGGTVTLTPSGAMKVISSDASYSSGIKAVDFVQNGGTLTITASGAAGRGISATNITTNGGVLKITNSGAGQSGTNDSYTAKGLKADTKIALNAGTITISMTGTGGKGIKSSGTYTQGVSGGDGPTLTVSTTGSSFGSSGSSGGWGGMMPGQQNSGSSAKAIKVQGTVTLYGGETVITTSTDGAEGLESKTAIYVEGGKHYLKCYDDCINSSGNIYFNGGVTVCYSNGNDAIDSNAGRSGAITIGNGTVFSYTTKGSPEEGLDCDNNSYIVINGTGTAISAGGTQGGGSNSSIGSATQGYTLRTTSTSYTTGNYYTLADASGNNLITFSFEGSLTSTLSLITATGMKSGSTYTVKYNSTAPTNATTAWHGVYLGSTHTGTNSLFSFTAK